MLRRLNALITFAAVAVLTTAHSASAQETMGSGAQASAGTGIGVGVAQLLTRSNGLGPGDSFLFAGPGGPAIVYQAPDFHIEGILGVHSEGATRFALAGRFFYELHSGDLADFGLGGGLGVVNYSNGNSDADLHLEAGAQIRAFLAPNVALSATLGIGFVADEGDDFFGVLGQLTGGMGITYFFF